MKTYPNDPDFYKPIDETIASFGYRSSNLEHLNELYKTYFEGNIPDGIDHIYIVPDGDLYRIPFEILPTEPVESPHSYGSARYLIEDYSVSYLNTLGDLTKKQNGSNGHFETDIAAFGISNFSEAGHQQLADLPFSPIEVVNTVNNLNSLDRSQMFIEKNSSESNFKNIAGHARIIHLATHSRVLDNNPLFSSFYLYSGIEDPTTVTDPESRLNDGIVRVYEIFDLNLNADLIFLSSCESGSGGYLQGAGILGFSRAFSYAGAKSLILNLWPVRDQASAELTP
ncbi:MAG: CHAT domain-containing protein, partial [Balneolaceae bacterium]